MPKKTLKLRKSDSGKKTKEVAARKRMQASSIQKK
jgi:hypothetical protein